MISVTTANGNGAMAALEFGPPARKLDVVFLHANGFNAMTYRQLLEPLGHDLRILAVDMRGHGRTTLPASGRHHSWQVYATDLVALLAAIGETPRILAGHSMGATTALLALPLLPAQSLPRLVLAEPVLPPRTLYGPEPVMDTPMALAALRRRDIFASRDEAFAAYKGRGAFRTWKDATLRDYLEDGLSENPDGTLRLSCTPAWEAANFAHYGIANPYAVLDAPPTSIHIIRAENESTCSFEPSDGDADISMETLVGATHFLPMEKPQRLREAVLF